MKKGLKSFIAFVLVLVIGAGSFLIFKSSQGISYDISSLEKLESDVEIVSETEEALP